MKLQTNLEDLALEVSVKKIIPFMTSVERYPWLGFIFYPRGIIGSILVKLHQMQLQTKAGRLDPGSFC